MLGYKIYFLAATVLYACTPVDGDRKVLTHQRVFVISDTPLQTDPKRGVSNTSPADTSYLESVFKAYDLVDIQQLDSSIQVKLAYADTANFLKINFYDGLRHAYFPCEVAIGLCNAQYFLKQINPGLSLEVLDAARPLHLQKMMWDSLKMPINKKYNYLSPPYETSLHNYGCAVDLTIVNITESKALDMGTNFDCFMRTSQPIFEQSLLKNGSLSRTAYDNRKLLRYSMKKGGFSPIPSEWWHFGYCSKQRAAAKFKLIK